MTATGINFGYWAKVATIQIWEAALLMHGYDPRARSHGYMPLDEFGDELDLADDHRLLTSAALATEIEAIADTAVQVGLNTHIKRASFTVWARFNGYDALADGLEGKSRVATAPDPERRLARLRELKGTIEYDSHEGRWLIKGIGALTNAEASENRRRVSEKTIRADLIAAAEAERNAARAGSPRGVFPAA